MAYPHTIKAFDESDKPYEHPKLQSKPLVVDPRKLNVKSPSNVKDLLYSGFIEHVGRGIYGGVVDDPAHPASTKLLEPQDDGKSSHLKGRLGWRKDVMSVFADELEMPVLRWPGGNFVSNYHWQDGIGPIESRPQRIELAWLSTESNMFGTDEFIAYARAAKVEPYLCLNMGTGTLEEALAWLEYCNGTGNTHWANLRRKHTGRSEPHNVKYWGLGNEMHGPWQVGHLPAKQYAQKARGWSHALRLVDPTIKLVSCGNQGSSDWDREVLLELVGIVDMHSIHFYSMLGHEHETKPGLEYEKNVFGPAAAERSIEICSSLIDMAKIENVATIFDWAKRDAGGSIKREVKICYDEWNVWDEAKAPGAVGLEQTYEFVDMLATAAWLNLLVRKHEDLGLACFAQSVNVISPVMTSPEGLLFQVTYFPLQLFSKYMKNGRLLDLGFDGETYDGPTHPSWIKYLAPPTYVDVVGIIVHDGGKASIRLSILNRHPEDDWTGPIVFPGFEVDSVQIHSLYSDDVFAKNTWEEPKLLVPSVQQLSGNEWMDRGKCFTVQKHSWSFFILDGRLSS